jgi:hypothetical protein
MKRTILMILAVATLAGFSACQKTEAISPNRTVFIEIPGSAWQLNEGGTIWSVEYAVPQITNYIYERGTVRADISFVDGIYSPVTDVYTDGVAYRMDYGPGVIWLDAFYADVLGDQPVRPGNSLLKLIISESD